MSATPPDPAKIDQFARLLAGAESVLFITGAGLSADSGLPTYRGIGGLYSQGETEEGLPIEEILSGRMMRRRPELCWKYLLHLERNCRGAKPNPAHEILAALEKRIPRVWVLTQNVDGFHRGAGSENVIEIHGNLYRLRCPSCGWEEEVASFAHLHETPGCPHCAQVIRPDVVLFGELLPERATAVLQRELDRGFDLVVSIGTSSLFPYIAEPVVMTRFQGRPAVEINPDDTEVTRVVDLKIRSGARASFEALWPVFLSLANS